MKELAVIRAYKYGKGDEVESVPYFIVSGAGDVDDDYDKYVDSNNLALKPFYGFDIISEKLTATIHDEIRYIGQSTFEEDVQDWLAISRSKFKKYNIVEWYAVYEIEEGYYGLDQDFERYFVFLGQLDETNLEILTLDKGDN